jgi:hypothetical protein
MRAATEREPMSHAMVAGVSPRSKRACNSVASVGRSAVFER